MHEVAGSSPAVPTIAKGRVDLPFAMVGMRAGSLQNPLADFERTSDLWSASCRGAPALRETAKLGTKYKKFTIIAKDKHAELLINPMKN